MTAASVVPPTRPDPAVVDALRAAGVGSPDWDARLLEDHAGRTGAGLDDLVARRAAREPLQHILGVSWFRHLELAVGPGVFVPRPETELLVDAALVALDDAPPESSGLPVVVDLCAGSGAVGLSVAQERAMHGRPTEVHLVDVDDAALPWLRRNAGVLSAAYPLASLTVHHADLATAPAGLDGSVDVVTANPPYLPIAATAALDPETARHDPAIALWGGEDGLDVVRRVVLAARRLLRPGGTLVVEHDSGHDLSGLLAEWRDVRPRADLTVRPRFTTAVAP